MACDEVNISKRGTVVEASERIELLLVGSLFNVTVVR